MSRIFRNDGKTVIVAIDHGSALQVLPELKKTGEKIRAIAEGGSDAFIVNYGTALCYREELKSTGLILRLDGGSSVLSENPGGVLLYQLEDALKIGADAVAVMGFPGAPNEEETLGNIACLAAKCREWDVPLIAEMLPGGFAPEPANTVENVKLAARIGAELGASVIKTTFSGTAEEFREIVEGCFVPVVILGGNHTTDLQGLFQVVRGSIDAGSAGVAIGRNIWKHERPGAVTRALVSIVHEGKGYQEALRLIG